MVIQGLQIHHDPPKTDEKATRVVDITSKSSAELIAHIRLYPFAQRCKMRGLKQLAVRKFAMATAEELFRVSGFELVVRETCRLTTSEDAMRDEVFKAMSEHIDELRESEDFVRGMIGMKGFSIDHGDSPEEVGRKLFACI